MSRHRAEPPRRHARAAGRSPACRRREPRYGRLAVLGASVSVTGIAMLGGVGVLPSVAGDSGDRRRHRARLERCGLGAGRRRDHAVRTAVHRAMTSRRPQGGAGGGKANGQPASSRRATDPRTTPRPVTRRDANPPVPDDSGDGRRIVFDQSDQRVWLVDDDEGVERTYLVSGSLYDNLEPGTYSVYSRSEQAVGHRRLRDDEVLRPLHRGRQRRGHRLPRHPGRRRRARADRRPSWARRSRTAASVRSARTPSRCGSSPRSAPRSTSPRERGCRFPRAPGAA